MVLLQLTTEQMNNQGLVILFWIIGIVFSCFLLRWVLAIGERTKQNKQIIYLLKLIAEKQGATKDEIHIAQTV